MIASLPMYWRAETADAWRAFWGRVQDAAQDLALPDLTPPENLSPAWSDHWLRPDLALSMTCGLPFRTALKDRVTYVATLGFGLDAPPGHYHSQVVAHADADLTTPLRLAYNSDDSQSGWAVTQSAPPFDEPPTFSALIETGSHAASLAAVAEGRADIAYLDAVTFRLLDRHDPNAKRVRVIGPSIATPGLPFITALGTDPARLRAALAQAVATTPQPEQTTLGGPLSLHILDPAAYYAVPIPKPPAI